MPPATTNSNETSGLAQLTIWTSPLAGSLATLDATGSVVVIVETMPGGGAEVRAHDGSSGAVRWSTPVGANEIVTPGALEIDPTGTRVVLASLFGGSPTGVVAHTGLSLVDGSVQWSSVETYGTEADPYDIAFGPGGVILFAIRAEDVGTRSIVTAFDPATETEIWSHAEGVSGL